MIQPQTAGIRLAVEKNMAVLKVILTAVLWSCLFAFVPGLNKVSSGFVIIICAVVSAALFAAIAPVEEE